MKRKFTFSSDTCQLAEIRREARAFLSECGFEECAAELLILALDEACTNIIRYAYGGSTSRVIRIAMESTRRGIRCTLRDYGNMSSPSVLFVLEETLQTHSPAATPGDLWLVSFGAGTASGALVLSVNR